MPNQDHHHKEGQIYRQEAHRPLEACLTFNLGILVEGQDVQGAKGRLPEGRQEGPVLRCDLLTRQASLGHEREVQGQGRPEHAGGVAALERRAEALLGQGLDGEALTLGPGGLRSCWPTT